MLVALVVMWVVAGIMTATVVSVAEVLASAATVVIIAVTVM